MQFLCMYFTRDRHYDAKIYITCFRQKTHIFCTPLLVHVCGLFIDLKLLTSV